VVVIVAIVVPARLAKGGVLWVVRVVKVVALKNVNVIAVIIAVCHVQVNVPMMLAARFAKKPAPVVVVPARVAAAWLARPVIAAEIAQ
jgi:hypothetical protein